METRKEMWKRVKKEVSKDIWKQLQKERRRHGNSTGQALYLIGIAMKSPNREIELTDYIPLFEDANNRRDIIRNSFIPLMEEIIQKLGLEDLKINKTNHTLKYDLTYIKKI